MKNFGRVIKEINLNLNKFVIFQELLTASIIFLGFYIFFTFVRFNFIDPAYAIVPAGVYLGVELFYRIQKDKLMIVEEKYAFLNEKLRTAADNLDKKNEMVTHLQNEIVGDLRRVNTASFFDIKQTSMKVIIVLILCFLLIFLNTFHIMGLKIDIGELAAKDIPNVLGEGNGPAELFAGGPGGIGDVPVDEDIFGLENVAKLGDEELELGVKTMGFEINVRNVQEATKREYDEIFPADDVTAQSASAFEEDIPQEQQQIVSSYFEDLARK